MLEVTIFEETIAKYYNSKYAVATDSCTHALELCLRLKNCYKVSCPKQTYISVPMTCEKLNINWHFTNAAWRDFYFIGNSNIVDAAVYWKQNGYISNTLMCLSFQYKKHLNIGKGGMILLDNEKEYILLKKMSYDGRLPNVPWAQQNIDILGYHYYMTPESAQIGLNKFNIVKDLKPKEWSYIDYPDLTKMKVFNHVQCK